MKCDTGLLRAYVDDALSEAEWAAVAGHLMGCAACQAELVTLQKRSTRVMARLAVLEPEADEAPDPTAALARFHAGQRVQAASRPVAGRELWTNLRRSYETMKQSLLTGWRRPVTISATAVACLLILFSFAPVRQAAADFLGIFRVRKFAVIPLDQQQMGRLETLMEQVDTGAFGEPQLTREMGLEQPVADAEQATALAGYSVRTPGQLPEGAVLEKFTVQAGPAMHFEIDRATLEMVLRAAGSGTDGLPQTEKLTFDVDVASTVVQRYRLGRNRLELLQVPSPAVDLPEGVNPVALAETAFLFLGMPAEDAHRIATSIDWTSTLVIPLPTQAARAREVSIDGVTGLMIEDVRSGYKNNALLWERDGVLYSLNGASVDQTLLLYVADSLK